MLQMKLLPLSLALMMVTSLLQDDSKVTQPNYALANFSHVGTPMQFLQNSDC